LPQKVSHAFDVLFFRFFAGQVLKPQTK